MKQIAVILLLAFAVVVAIALKGRTHRRAQASDQAFIAARNTYPADETLDPRKDDLERQIEQEMWNSPRALRRRRQAIAQQLAQDQEQDRRRRDEARRAGLAAPDNTALLVQSEQASIARIDKRLKALARYNAWCPQCETLPRATGAQ